MCRIRSAHRRKHPQMTQRLETWSCARQGGQRCLKNRFQRRHDANGIMSATPDEEQRLCALPQPRGVRCGRGTFHFENCSGTDFLCQDERRVQIACLCCHIHTMSSFMFRLDLVEHESLISFESEFWKAFLVGSLGIFALTF